MKKSLIAIALLGAFSAPAFADTTLYGLVDVFTAEATASGKSSALLVGSGGLATSRLGVKNVEDLGDGLKSLIVLEYRLDPNLDTPVGSAPAGMSAASGPARQQLIGLTGEFGTLAAGRLQTAAYDWEVAFDPLAGSSISALQFSNGKFNIGTTAAHARANNAIAYMAPEFYGVKLAANYALASENVGSAATGTPTGQPSTQVSAFLLSATATQGDLSAGLVYDKQSANTAPNADASIVPGANNLDIATGLSYNFGVAKLFGTYQTHKVQYQSSTTAVGNADKAFSLSGVVPLGSDAVVGSFGRLVKSSVQPLDANSTSYTLAYTHSFSKTTTLYGSYSHISNGLNGTNGVSAYGSLLGTGDAKASIAPTPDGNSQLLVVGLQKKF